MKLCHNDGHICIRKPEISSGIKKLKTVGQILVKFLAEKTVQITDEKDLEQFLKITVVQNPTTSYVKPSYKDAFSNNNSVLNATASTVVSRETRDKFITSTPMQGHPFLTL